MELRAQLGDKDQATLAREMYETDVYAHNIVPRHGHP